MFVNFKLKVAAAEAAGLDTTQAFREELEGYRRQLAKAYLTDESVSELAARQVHDKMKANNRAGQIRVSHIFKSLPQTVTVMCCVLQKLGWILFMPHCRMGRRTLMSVYVISLMKKNLFG